MSTCGSKGLRNTDRSVILKRYVYRVLQICQSTAGQIHHQMIVLIKELNGIFSHLNVLLLVENVPVSRIPYCRKSRTVSKEPLRSYFTRVWRRREHIHPKESNIFTRNIWNKELGTSHCNTSNRVWDNVQSTSNQRILYDKRSFKTLNLNIQVEVIPKQIFSPIV